VLKSKYAKKVLVSVGPYLAYYLLRFIYTTCKKEFMFDENYKGQDIIPASWHGQLGFSHFVLIELNKKFGMKKPLMMISNHSDGEIISKIFKLFGFDSIRGSSSKSAVKVLLEAINLVKKDKKIIALTPDGPRGPRHSVADGVAVIAKKAKIDILAVSFDCSNYWQFKSWDKFVLPKPFSTIRFYAKIVEVKDLEIIDIKNKLKEELLKNAI
jgi:lysophospholipid acyltransferase (LPLAT)-like uncharacterized protein